MYHMAVRQHQAIRREHESRATALTFARLAIPRSIDRLRNFDLGNGRAYLLGRRDYRVGIRIQQYVVFTRGRGIEKWPVSKLSSGKILFQHGW